MPHFSMPDTIATHQHATPSGERSSYKIGILTDTINFDVEVHSRRNVGTRNMHMWLVPGGHVCIFARGECGVYIMCVFIPPPVHTHRQR